LVAEIEHRSQEIDMDNKNNARRRGLELLDTLHGGHVGEAMVDEMKTICPDFAIMTIEWAINGIMGRPGLDLATRELLLVASCVTRGNAQPQLRAHMESAAKLGVSREKMIESLLTLLFYAGGPSVRNALVEIPSVYEACETADAASR
jgi:4-carboxymuconolactone decarboxylase